MNINGFTDKFPHALPEMEKQLGDPEKLTPIVDLEKLKEEVTEDPVLEKLTEDAIEYCERYTETVAAFHEILSNLTRDNQKEFEEIDQTRKIVHDAAVDSINILSRALAKSGRDSSWIKMFKSRADYGKFALVTTYKALKEFQKERNDNGKK